MKKQNHYRVTLYPHATSIVNEMAMWAIKSNGNHKQWFTLEDIASVFKLDKLKYPNSNDGCECHVIGNSLTVDETKDNKTVCLLAIEEIELLALEPDQPPYLVHQETEY